jgi:hypothetical protein
MIFEEHNVFCGLNKCDAKLGVLATLKQRIRRGIYMVFGPGNLTFFPTIIFSGKEMK